jgi:hypothetical protein
MELERVDAPQWWLPETVFRPAPDLIGGPFRVGLDWMGSVWTRLDRFGCQSIKGNPPDPR